MADQRYTAAPFDYGRSFRAIRSLLLAYLLTESDFELTAENGRPLIL